jgi:hypothetical protein
MVLTRDFVYCSDLDSSPSIAYHELIDGRLTGVPGIEISQVLRLDALVAARSGRSADPEGQPAAVFVDWRTVVPVARDTETKNRQFHEMFATAKVFPIPGLRRWWVLAISRGDDLRLAPYCAGSDGVEDFPDAFDLPALVRERPEGDLADWPGSLISESL